ncbi:hypothetical protein Aph01nite_79560 [Acrocarpospora phusangensis]|uniref:Uncharacterized protein n=1 Tax=Acrocarpospora phusangensis TaxID=1070424 RepID=A0A919QKW9_9ACTN|nr:hypothetical protein [Acrocarpospora phusangensis]GIH29646.1 hypothetical protein Aph01nite_79560 [Acrocarpospora phusangensis]
MTLTQQEITSGIALASVPAPDPATTVRALSGRFPRWTIWWGESTGRYWGMCRRARGTLVSVEAKSAQEFVQKARDIEYRTLQNNL